MYGHVVEGRESEIVTPISKQLSIRPRNSTSSTSFAHLHCSSAQK